MGPQERLNEYLREVQDRPFAWGFHDCFTFTNTAFRIMHGKGYADDWVGRYMINGRPMRRDELRDEFGCFTLERALDDRLQRVDKPQRFALVTTRRAQRWVTGVALGICVGTKSLFLGKGEFISLRHQDISDTWIAR